MAITPTQIHQIIDAHALGLLDPAIASRAGVSIATVKRYRDRLGLETNSVTAKRGRLGERLVAEEALRRGFSVEWREKENAAYDLYVNSQKVDAKATMQLGDGSWRFRLHTTRVSYYHQYSYPKDYAADCDLVVLVTLYPDGCAPDFYLLESDSLPGDIRIRPSGVYSAFRNDWTAAEWGSVPIRA